MKFKANGLYQIMINAVWLAFTATLVIYFKNPKYLWLLALLGLSTIYTED